jgi:hypothetical protein
LTPAENSLRHDTISRCTLRLSSGETSVLYSDLDGNFYTMDEYNQLYQDYLKSGGGPLSGFNKENLEEMIVFLQEKQ